MNQFSLMIVKTANDGEKNKQQHLSVRYLHDDASTNPLISREEGDRYQLHIMNHDLNLVVLQDLHR